MNDNSLNLSDSAYEMVADNVRSGTKIGEISAFEKDLIQNDVLNPAQKNISQPEDWDDLEKHLAQNLQDYKEGDIVTARIRMIKKSGLLVDFSYKSDGFIPTNELSESTQKNIEKDMVLKAMIEKLETKEGYSLLSESKARSELIWDDLFDLMTEKAVVSVQIRKVTPKGYMVDYSHVSGFLHYEEGDAFKEKDVVQAMIVQVDKRRKKVLFSTRNIQSFLIQKEEMGKFFDTLSVGDRLSGVVSGIKKFGAFVNFGDAEGLVHVSEMSWRRITSPTELVAVGDTVDVVILGIDKNEGRLSLGMKQLMPDPWETVDTDLPVGEVFNGTVIRILDFGAFILLENGLEGLVHISEVSTKRIQELGTVLSLNDSVKVKVIKVTKHDQKIGLSMKNVDQDNSALLNRLEDL